MGELLDAVITTHGAMDRGKAVRSIAQTGPPAH
jgi:hypothetical protein